MEPPVGVRRFVRQDGSGSRHFHGAPALLSAGNGLFSSAGPSRSSILIDSFTPPPSTPPPTTSALRSRWRSRRAAPTPARAPRRHRREGREGRPRPRLGT